MKSLLGLAFGAGLALAAATTARAGDAPAAPMGPIHVTDYVEVTPPSTNLMIDAVKQYRDAARAEPGAMTVEVYQELGAPARLVTREIWRDAQAADAHSKAASTTSLADKLKPIQYGPTDSRAHDVFFGTGTGSAAAGNVVIVRMIARIRNLNLILSRASA